MRQELLGQWSPRKHAVLALTLILLYFWRRPDALSSPQFYSEDLCIFFAEQVRYGWASLLRPYNGYESFLLRLIALLAGLVPVYHQPLFYSICTLTLQGVAGAVFYLPGFRHLVASDTLRGTMCLAYVAASPAFEIAGTLTNLQWPLMVAALLLLVYEPAADSRKLPVFRAACVFLCGLTAALLVLAVPVAIWRIWRGPKRERLVALACIVASLIQVCVYFLFPPPPAASPGRYTLPQVFLAVSSSLVYRSVLYTLAGSHAVLRMAETGFPPLVLLATMLSGWVVWLVWSLERQRIYILGAVYLSAASVAVPLVARDILKYFYTVDQQSIWYAHRHMVLPAAVTLLFLGLTLERTISPARNWLRLLCLALAVSGGVASNFRLPALADLHWAREAARIEAALSSGMPIDVQVNPPGKTCSIP